MTNAQSGRVAQGGSTLTQQYVKNALSQSATDKAGQDAATGEGVKELVRSIADALDKIPRVLAHPDADADGNAGTHPTAASAHHKREDEAHLPLVSGEDES